MNNHDLPHVAENEDSDVSYDRWFRSKVQLALDDHVPGIPHDQVMSEMRDLLIAKLLLRATD
ncbi:antitoxin [Pseudomonas sp. CCM 7893]|uniref:Antitoxin n=1 Tax=Pseudomonas spelaei TaxID=1055469 RepID=A0A6I3VYE6_9PSED|nr:antitoxin [Pseudomonas spelaei]MUF03400.1 antitoxin [Pseudomonas spelaei]